MFGYIRPLAAELRVKEYAYYRAVYCGVCKSMEKTVSPLLSSTSITTRQREETKHSANQRSLRSRYSVSEEGRAKTSVGVVPLMEKSADARASLPSAPSSTASNRYGPAIIRSP